MSQRIKKINELIKRTLGKIILKEFEAPEDVLVTITRVETTSNLIESKVFISIIPKKKEEKVIASLRKCVYYIQQELNKKLNIRIVPKIIFKIDESIEKAVKVKKLLDKIKEEKAW